MPKTAHFPGTATDDQDIQSRVIGSLGSRSDRRLAARADMSRSKSIPPGVRQFLLAHIDSVPALETLLIMRSDGRPDWSAEEIATRTYLDTSQALGVLATLVRAGLVSHQSSEGKYRLSLKDDAQRALLDEVANAYKTHLIQMATLIHGKPPSAVNEFARAFELKKDR